MDIRSKHKLKKKRTRRNLNDLRKRSCSEVKNILNSTRQNSLELKNIPNNNNSLFTCNRLTLALFKKSVRSKPATRVSLSRIDNTNNVTKANNNNILSNIFTNVSHQSDSQFSDICKSSKICENNNIVDFQSSESVVLSNKNAYGGINDISEGDGNFTPCSLSFRDQSTNLADLTFEESNYMCEYLSSSSFLNSETESGHCAYKKFMQDLPGYLQEHFPALTGSFVNKTIVSLKKSYLENCNRQKQINKIHENAVNIADHRDAVIQNPMDYIRTLSSEQGAKIKPSKMSSNSSSPSLSEFESVPVNSCLFWNSPEYQYFPHKLNQ